MKLWLVEKDNNCGEVAFAGVFSTKELAERAAAKIRDNPWNAGQAGPWITEITVDEIYREE